MSFTLKAENLSALLISTSNYKKESAFTENLEARSNLDSMKALLSDAYILGLPQEKIVTIVDEANNTKLLEKLAQLSDSTEDAFLFYFNGNLVVRKNKIFLASTNSTVAQAHINAISLESIIDILEESAAKQIYFIFDVTYHSYHSDENIHAVLEDRFAFYNNEGKHKLFLCSNTANHTSFTSDFSKILTNGHQKETEHISFSDASELLINSLREYNELTPFSFIQTEVKEANHAFILNTRFQKYLRNKKEAELYFESESYQAALPFYKMAEELYENDSNKRKIKFISLIQDADEAFNKGELIESKNCFKEAISLYDSKYAVEGIKNILNSTGDAEFNLGNFEDAKNSYLELERIEGSEDLRSKIELCEKEIQFSNFNDEADQAFFTNDFHKAYKLYDKALELKHSLQLVRRKEECDRFIKQEVNIRERVEEEIKAQYENELRQQSSTDSFVTEIKDELKSNIEKEFNSKIDGELWRRVAIMNDLGAYQLYLGIFPQGSYAQKALQRINEIHEIEEQKIAVEAAIENSVNTPKNDQPTSNIPNELLLRLRTDNIEDVLVEIKHKMGDSTSISAEEVVTQVESITIEEVKEEIIEDKTIIDNPQQEVIPEEPIAEVEEIQEEEATKETPVAQEEVEEEPQKNVIVVESQKKEKVVPEEEQHIVVVTPDDSEELELLDEDSLWNYAEREGSIEAYMAYVNHTKASLHLADAYHMINKLNLDDLQEEATEEIEIPQDTAVEIEETVTTTDEPAEIVEEAVIQETETTIEEEVTSSEDIDAKVNHAFDDSLDEIVGAAESEEGNNQITVGLIDNKEMEGLLEEELWAKAAQEDTIASYKTYLSFTEESDHIADAYTRIGQLQNAEDNNTSAPIVETPIIEDTVVEEPVIEEPIVEQTVVEEEKVEETVAETPQEDVSSVMQTLQTEPKDNNPSAIDEDGIWVTAQAEDTLSAYFNYLNLTLEKKYWSEAKDRIHQLKNDSVQEEVQDWENTEKEDTLEAYKAYIEKYPLGNHYAKAMFRIDKIS